MKCTQKQLNKIKTCIVALVLCCAVSGAYAQTLITPTMSDQFWYHTTGQLVGINTAMIAYNTSGPQYFFASAALDASGSYIYVNDPITGTTRAISSTSTMASVPDIIIGNNNTGFGSATEDFILATAFVNGSGYAEVDFYQVHDDGINPINIFQLTHLDASLANSTTTGTVNTYSAANLDVVADYGNTGITGLPFCNKFVLTWADYSGAYPEIYAALGDLGTQSVSTPQLLGPATGVGAYGVMPDVAAVRRHVGGSLDYTAWITYIDWASGELYITEYDFSTNTTLSGGVLDNLSTAVNVMVPRIDAYDNYTTAGSPAHYKVVAFAENMSSPRQIEIRTYDNNLGYGYNYVSSSSIDVTSAGLPWSLYSPPYNNYWPTVAAGSDYTVFHQTQVTSGQFVMFMEPIDIYTSAIVNPPNYYYWVNGSSTLTSFGSYAPSGSVSTAPNDPTLQTVYVYGYYNGSTFEVDYKTPSGYSFRQSPTAVTNVQAGDWQIYPNPATDLLTVNNTAVANAPTEYHILDMEGRELIKGGLGTGSTKIDVTNLVPGTYAIQVYDNGELYGGRLFVKN